jgi:hypothetical protein
MTHNHITEIFRKFGVSGGAGLMATRLGKTTSAQPAPGQPVVLVNMCRGAHTALLRNDKVKEFRHDRFRTQAPRSDPFSRSAGTPGCLSESGPRGKTIASCPEASRRPKRPRPRDQSSTTHFGIAADFCPAHHGVTS